MKKPLKLGKVDCSDDKVVVVLGGGISDNGALPDHVEKRLQRAFELGGKSATYICSSIFTLNKSQVAQQGWVLSEAVEMKKFLQRVYSVDNVFVENASYDTIGSSLFVRLFFDFMLENKQLVIVTSDFHIDRVRLIFSKIFNLYPKINFKSIQFTSSQSNINSSERTQHEVYAIRKFSELSVNWTNINDVKLWLFTHHDNYNNFRSSRITDRDFSEMGY